MGLGLTYSYYPVIIVVDAKQDCKYVLYYSSALYCKQVAALNEVQSTWMFKSFQLK